MFAKLAILAACVAGLAGTADASDRATLDGGNLRLVAGDVSGDTAEFGLVIDLEPGWKTYWRSPGDSGVPPRFDLGPSRNVASLAVDYPAPHRFGDADAPSLGYTGRIVLPIRVSLSKAGDPARLTLNISLGLCREICIPLTESLTADVAAEASPEARRLIDSARRAVPRPAAPDDGPFARVAGLDSRPGKAPLLTLDVRDSAGRAIDDVLAEGLGDWDPAQPVRARNATGLPVWTLDLDGLPVSAAPGGRRLRLTMIAGGEAREQEIILPDASAPLPK